MNSKLLEKHFSRMGVRIKTIPHRPIPTRWGGFRNGLAGNFSVDVQRDGRGEHFVFNIREECEDKVQVDVLQVKPKDRHLVLLVKDFAAEGSEETKDRFLCGHDEREWFVAAVPGAVSTVADAMESLKPAAVRRVQADHGLNAKKRNQRRNSAFRRQGEWFFVPLPEAFVDESTVLTNEPIARSGGKPHIVQYLYREGGRLVFVCPRHPDGLSEEKYDALIRSKPKAKGWGWQTRRINPRVLARGDIRHPDHKTITLHGWHEVLMNRESQSRTMQHVAFID